MRPFDRPEPGQSATLLVGVAVGWGLLLFVLAWFLPLVTPQDPPTYATAAPTALATAPTSLAAPPAQAGGVLVADPRVSLVAADGHGVLLLVALPLLVSLLVGGLLRLAVHRRSAPAAVAAWALAGAALAAAAVGSVTVLVGIFAAPVGALLLAACGQAGRPLPPPAGARPA
ncbi:hypothetical protein GXW83_12525 [Streptacidiphilus sp. PB12-B1b]|uniref:hypothetical protein n=1 Tax=Streptacidiphilus sp. PB12-B1b TaxID=2705012 RepID=UPI0015FAEDCD|nr:hypothetical protein [Streptacidiphilus sp. PB12-B1b]QMU76441.1 hypothetical protein GXW83_12525 [Streptacidiphilus sp. PB12-B1b]